MKRRRMTMRQLHERMATACVRCGLPKAEHVPVMEPEDVKLQCPRPNVSPWKYYQAPSPPAGGEPSPKEGP